MAPSVLPCHPSNFLQLERPKPEVSSVSARSLVGAPSGRLWSPGNPLGTDSGPSGCPTAVLGWKQDWNHHLTKTASPHLVSLAVKGWTRAWMGRKLKPLPILPAAAVDEADVGKWRGGSSQQKQALGAGSASGPLCLLETHSWGPGPFVK